MREYDRFLLSLIAWFAALGLALSPGVGTPRPAAAEISTRVLDVASDGQVTLALPEGGVVTRGDPVRIGAELAGVGRVDITTPWRIDAVFGAKARATPQETPSVMPQVGYLATITTEMAQKPTPAGDGMVVLGDGSDSESKPQESDAFHPVDINSVAPEDWPGIFAATLLAATDGDVGALFQLGYLHEKGLGTPPDRVKAIDAYRAASLAGNADASQCLCSLFLVNGPQPETVGSAFAECGLAARAGRGSAMFNLGLMYLDGHGTSPDPAEAWRWFQAALDAGVPDAHAGLGLMLFEGSAPFVDPAGAARHLFEAFEDAGSGFAAYALDVIVSDGPRAPLAFRQQVQRILAEAGAYSGAIDGVFGPGTLGAIEMLRKERFGSP